MKRIALSLWVALMVSGCVTAPGVHGHLYPVEGPVTVQAPAPIYTVTLNMLSVKRDISATLPNGEVCQGSLQTLGQNDPAARSMEADWDRVYGEGFFMATLLGKDRGHATLTGIEGACMRIELFNPQHDELLDTILLDSVEGVARDEQGNRSAGEPDLPHRPHAVCARSAGQGGRLAPAQGPQREGPAGVCVSSDTEA